MTPEFVKQKFNAGLTLDQHIATGKEQQQERWRNVVAKSTITAEQRNLVRSFSRQMNLLVVSGVWCGDCIEQLPLIQTIADANPQKLTMRIVDRDEHTDLSSQLKINGGARVPVVLFLAEDFELCGIYGDRPLSRYRAIAVRKIGPACSLGAVVPPDEELAATTADWLAEIERMQLLLRLSPRLREKYGD